jgi:hypothetical protein
MSAATMYMTLLSQRSGVSISVVSDPTVNVAPIVGATPDVTPAVWSSGATDTERWEMAASDAGPWSTVSDMPAVDTPYTAQTFGKVLRWFESQGGAEAVSAATGRVAEAPVQTLGTQLATNPLFDTWSGDNPTGWTVAGESAPAAEVTQRDPDQLHADVMTTGGAANLYRSGSGSQPILYQDILTIGSYFLTEAVVSDNASGAVVFEDSNGNMGVFLSGVGTYRQLGRATTTRLQFRVFQDPTDKTLNSASAKALTLNAQLTAPSADMRLDFFYTLPGSPAVGTCVWLLPRISDFASGNYWLGFLRWTGSQWDVNLYSVASHSRTSRIAASNIAATNGLRVNMNGTALELFTTVNGGGAWTSRGTFTSSTYQTATAVNVLHTSDVVAGQLVYAPAV